jgi:hypothetical protein
MRAEAERVLGGVADAVNDAPDGHVIGGSEMRVRDLMAEVRARVFERAVRMRVDETEGALPPLPRTRRRAGPSAIRGGRPGRC